MEEAIPHMDIIGSLLPKHNEVAEAPCVLKHKLKDMSIFDVDENIEALKPAREMKFKQLFEELRDGSQMIVTGVVDDIRLVFIENTDEIKNGEIPFIADDDEETSAWEMILMKDLDVDVERILDEVEKSDPMKHQLVFIYPEMQFGEFVRHIIVHTPIAVWKDEESKEIYKSLFEMTDWEIKRCDDEVKLFGGV